MEWYRQCALEKPTTKGNMVQISWIPDKFAKIGKFLKLLENGVWENGWMVASVGGRQTRDERVDRRKDHERQREGSDI